MNRECKVNINLLKVVLLSLIIAFSVNVCAERHSETITVNKNPVFVTHWYTAKTIDQPISAVLLSGPTDNWNSDSAWFARLAPKLAKTRRIITIDRPGQVLDTENAEVGYQPFAKYFDAITRHYQLKKFDIIAFASANLTLNQYFKNHGSDRVDSVIMIDPDVLLPYSMARYKKDALPFKQNLKAYREYIEAGKYSDRAKQKNDNEMEHLKTLAQNDSDTDWQYVDELFKKRLSVQNLTNLFTEIAKYDSDIEAAYQAGFPKSIPLTIIDTDFEQNYIDQNEDKKQKQALNAWREDAKSYYQQLTKASIKGNYLTPTTQEHLLPFSNPELIIRLLQGKNE